ncbi:30S ribosomal protein S9 [candidate division WOR-3 bacterium]|nr:30S ribosomal protein S9 [candidate division WOR-3 bacterium]
MPEELNKTDDIKTGRRKTAVARVRLVPGSGKRMINGRRFGDYFKRGSVLTLIESPLKLLNLSEKFDVLAKVHGGGVTGQAGALQLGISRSIVKLFPEKKVELRKQGFLTRNAKIVERKKYGRPKARKRFQFSKR